MRSILIEQAQFLVETDRMEPLEYLEVLNEINSLSEEELFSRAVDDLYEALEEGVITDEEFDGLVDEYAQDIGDDDGMQECGKCNEEDNLDEDLEVDEAMGLHGLSQTFAKTAKPPIKRAAKAIAKKLSSK